MIEAVEFSVSYGYREYRSFCFDHIPSEFPDLKLGWITRMIISAALFVPFTYKTTKMPVCHFRLDGAGIRRRTKLGELNIAWAQVKAIHRYSAGYLVEKNRGALPIPYRCLDPKQRSNLERLFQVRERELSDPAGENDV